jgi:hypothetical protein
MTDSPTSFARHAGVARFPRSDADLTSTTQCPACFHPLSAVVCTNCQLDLAHEAAAELALVSTDAAGLLRERIELIGRIRFETAMRARQLAAVAAANAAADPATVHPPARVVDVPVTVPAASAPPTSRPVSPFPSPAAQRPGQSGAPRRSSVQVGLIIVGVSLVSVAAIFFLVYAFINYGIVWRSVIIGAITVAAFIVASVLRRRGLGSTAEGIAAFAVVLVYLDAFAIRANDLFGTASSDALVYWGAALVVSAAGFTVWHRASAMRGASISAAIAFAPGVGLLVAGACEGLESGTRVFASFLAVALAALAHPFAGARAESRPPASAPERAIVVSIGGLGTVAAFFAAFVVTPDSAGGAALALVMLAVVALGHVAVIARTTADGAEADPTLAHTVVAFFAAVAAASVTVAVVTLAYRELPFGGAMLVSSVVPALVAAALGVAAVRSAPTPVGIAVRVAAMAAAAVTAVALLVPVGTVLTLDAAAVNNALSSGAWSRAPGDTIATGVRDALPAFAAIIAVLALAALFVRATARFGRVYIGVLWSGAVLLILAPPLLTTLAATMAGWFVVAGAALALLTWATRTGAWADRRPVALAVTATATVLGFAISWASAETWLAGSVATIALLLTSRLVLARSAVLERAALLAAAAAVSLVAAAAAGRQYGVDARFAPSDADDMALWVNALGVALFAGSALPSARVLSSLDRRVLFAFGAAAVVCTAPFSGSPILLPALFVVAIVGWMLTAATAWNTLERVVSAFALAPALVWALSGVDAAIDLPVDLAQLGVVTCALLAAALSLAFAARRPGYDLRQATDLGVGIVAVAAAVPFAFGGSRLVWLALLLAAVTALLSAASPAGLFAAVGRRKHLGWAALALATAALWWRLLETSVTAVEAYVLPLGAALAVIAALDWRARRGAETPTLAFAAMAVSIMPIALSAATDQLARAAIVGFVAAAMLLVGSVLRAPVWARPYLDGLAVTGFVSVLVLAVGQSARLAAVPLGGSNVAADLWLAAAFVVLFASAVGQCSGRPGDRPGTRVIAQSMTVSALVVVAVVESVLLDATTAGFWRALAIVVLYSALHVGGQLAHTPPFSRATGWIALALGSVVGMVAVAAGAVEAVEWVSAPVAVALLVSGILRLRAEPQLRSWPALGAGLVVLLTPSLVQSQADADVWRLVAIGVAAVAALVVGVVLRLQAPFVVGGVVALVHGFATFAPQLLDVYQATEWWVWIGIGGAIIIVLGARYERSIATAKNVIANIDGLR